MKIAGRRKYLVALESVAMTDIVLNMFIFFFISFSLLYTFNADRVHTIKITLPVAGNAEPLKGPVEARVTVTREGELYLDATRVGEDELKIELARRKAKNPELKVALRSDAQAPFRDAVRALSVLSGCRIRTLDIAVLHEKRAARGPHAAE